MPSTRTWLVAAVLLAALIGSLWASYRWSEDYFLSEISERGRESLTLSAENVRGWLGRYRSLPRIYAHNPDVQALLQSPEDPRLVDRVNGFLTEWNLSTGAADTYLLDKTGLTLAASNWDDAVTFVGNNYSFRPYYSQAMEGRLGRFFALGTSSKKRGYYFSYPVFAGPDIAGVTVVKVGVEEIERKLAASPHEVFITGPEGVILLSPRAEWQLKSLGPLDQAALARIREIRQFDLDALEPVGAFGTGLLDGEGQLLRADLDSETRGAEEYLHLAMPMAAQGWVLHSLVDTRFARTQMVTASLLTGSLLVGILLIATVIWQRRRRLVERLGEREQARAVLEETVKLRTADLQASNLRLEDEVAERKQAEEDLRRTQHELIQAGKLAALGQMSAAMSHEFNQPLAAIRTYAENAGTFLDRGREAEAQDNIAHIAALTDRMADLSRHLSSFARKPQDSVRPASLSGALDETLALLQGRFQAAGLSPRVIAPEEEIWVLGGHIRLQQVIMNLITNALDAMADVPEPALLLTLRQEGEAAQLIVEDNGSGLPQEQREQIFDPFFTTKEVGAGLGLGLSISFNIVKDFGGALSAENREAGGARFVVTLRSAEASGGAPQATATIDEAAE